MTPDPIDAYEKHLLACKPCQEYIPCIEGQHLLLDACEHALTLPKRDQDPVWVYPTPVKIPVDDSP